MKKYFILDLDGCVSDDRERYPLIDHWAADPWAAYHANCHKDELINEDIVLLSHTYEPIIFTARPESVREKTQEWLNMHFGRRISRLFMRPNGCRKSSPYLKAGFLVRLLASGVLIDEILVAIDDREDVLAMYRAAGLPVLLIKHPEV